MRPIGAGPRQMVQQERPFPSGGIKKTVDDVGDQIKHLFN